ncbi:14000_t:CDS:2 [Cetraspora pellucida]|uniref:14000_t:CDS:1 n=1 Tax=Cetraspora pellucida TaxID=1433469 RepID=A0A9N9D6Y0_9GLOM|nr:14000_t:CDS:2 [Cetraspora pellucida]
MPKSNKKTLCITTAKTFKYVELFSEDLKNIYNSSKVKMTHKATQVWVKVLEKFCTDISYEGRIEDIDLKSVLKDQLSKFVYAMKCKDDKKYYASSIKNCIAAIWHHLNEKLVLEKPVNILNPKVFYELNTVINRKIKNTLLCRSR